MAARPALAIVPLVLTAGATLFLLLVILAGTQDHAPLNQIYFLSADTSAINGAPDVSAWTLWNVCQATGGTLAQCPKASPAYPFDPSSNFASSGGVPNQFINNVSYYYYLSRVSFAFFIIAVFFSGVSLLLGLLACCSRIGAGITAFLSVAGLIAAIIAASLMTAVYVQAKNVFQSQGISSSIGVKAFAFAWSAVGCLLISTIGFCCACCMGRKDRASSGGRKFWGRSRKTQFDHETNVPVNGSF